MQSISHRAHQRSFTTGRTLALHGLQQMFFARVRFALVCIVQAMKHLLFAMLFEKITNRPRKQPASAQPHQSRSRISFP